MSERFDAGVECCEESVVHSDLVSLVREKLFKIFGDTTRIRILFVLFEAEVCVCDLAETLGMTQSAISHQLKILKASGLVRARRKGKSVFYSLADAHVRTIMAQGWEHINEET